jgi:hypothetical protein
MIVDSLDKDEKIKRVLKHLAGKFGEGSFKIKDYWEGDLCAIGLTDKDEKHLVYISTYSDNGYYISLENLKEYNGLPYEPVGDFENSDLRELERIFAQHLRLSAIE